MVATTSFSPEVQNDEDFWQHWNGPPPDVDLWSPPEDPDKPRLPYIPGLTVQIRRHTPPPPFGGPQYGFGTREELSEDYLRGVTQSELVIDHPALETPLPAQSEVAQLTITTPITIGSIRGSQVVACTIAPETENIKPFQAVAKIYDPLYYNFEWDFSHQPRDTVWQADSDYSREAAAYDHLEKTEQSCWAPTYHGTWTFSLSIISRGASSSRPVRMILLERLDGTTMRNMRVRNNPDPDEDEDAFHYPEAYRLEVLAMAMEHYVRMLHSGLDQADFASRNIVLATSTKSQAEVSVISGLPLPRVVLIDYNLSVVYSLTSRGKHPHTNPPLPVNPMKLWWGAPMNDFVGWVPNEWHETPRLKREWLKQRFGGVEHRKLYSMEEEPEFPMTDRSPQGSKG